MGPAMDSLYDLLRAAQCRLRTCEDGKRSTGRACAEVCALPARCTLRSEEQDCLRHVLRAASGAV